MPVTIQRGGETPMIVSLKTALNRLRHDADVCSLLDQLRRGETCQVTLRDGSTVGFSATNQPQQLRLAELELDPTLVPAPPPRRAFALECNLLIAIDANIVCVADDKKQATQMVTAVMMGESRPDENFQIEIDREQLEETFYRLDRAMRRGNAPHELATREIIINRIEER